MMTSIKTSLCTLVTISIAACGAATPTMELQTAREAYQKAQHSETARENPADLRVAQRTLQRAEQAFEDDPGSAREKHLGYIAFRQVEYANTKAKSALAQQAEERNQQTYERELKREAEAKRTYASNLSDARQQLAQVRSQMQQQGENLSSELQQKERELAAYVEKLRVAALVNHLPDRNSGQWLV